MVRCEMDSPEGVHVIAESWCSELDNFKRKIGTAIAFGRAWKALEEQRRAL